MLAYQLLDNCCDGVAIRSHQRRITYPNYLSQKHVIGSPKDRKIFHRLELYGIVMDCLVDRFFEPRRMAKQWWSFLRQTLVFLGKRRAMEIGQTIWWLNCQFLVASINRLASDNWQCVLLSLFVPGVYCTAVIRCYRRLLHITRYGSQYLQCDTHGCIPSRISTLLWTCVYLHDGRPSHRMGSCGLLL